MEYDYQPRTKDYENEKRGLTEKGRPNARGPLMGAGRPLVKTGELAYQAQRSRRLTPTDHGVTITLDVPRYAFMYKGASPNKIKELTTVSNNEVNILTRVLDKFIGKEANKG